MRKSAPLHLRLAVCAAVCVVSVLAQNPDTPPDKPFETVHLINLPTAGDEKMMLAALVEINAAIGKAGCPKCSYHLYKVYGAQAGSYNYLWTSSWPSGSVYTKVHNSPEYQAAVQKHQDIEKIQATQVYNRYVEVTPGK